MSQVYFKGSCDAVAVTNIYCIGRNYQAHIRELGNQQEETPLVFLKPTSALNIEPSIQLPTFSEEIDYETELVLLLGKEAKQIKATEALSCVAGYGVGLDLTARDLQAQAKKKGLPWTLAKGFDFAASISSFLPATEIKDPGSLSFQMKQNGVVRQEGKSCQMIFDIPYLIAHLSHYFSLQPGDLIFTGTPEGTGRLNRGDKLELSLDDKLTVNFAVS